MGCKDFLLQNKQHFGITENNLRGEYLDICAKNVRCIASRRINEDIILPSMSTFINSCTGLVDTAGGIDTQFASLRVTHAHEELVDCDTDCPGVKVTIKGQIIVRTRPTGCNGTVSYMAIPVQLVSETIRDFYSTATGERVKCLRNELPNIDGSCMVINLSCRVCREVCNGASRYVAQVKGSIVDKLWKSENIWVEGWRPYQAPSITVCDRFDKDFCSKDGGSCADFGHHLGCNNGCDNCGCSNDCGYDYNGCDCGNGCGNGCNSNYEYSNGCGCDSDNCPNSYGYNNCGNSCKNNSGCECGDCNGCGYGNGGYMHNGCYNNSCGDYARNSCCSNGCDDCARGCDDSCECDNDC